ncbi:MAG: hypothetical protein VW169_03200 [Rhodospirillaceae bacterium]
MEQNVRSGKSALIKSRNPTLVGETLKAHVEDIKARIEVLDCLKANTAGGEDILPVAATDAGSYPDLPKVDWWVISPDGPCRLSRVKGATLISPFSISGSCASSACRSPADKPSGTSTT